MVDCQHWLEPMLKAAEAELANERRAREEESHNLRRTIREIRAIVNGASMDELYHEALQARMEGMRQSPYNSVLGGGIGNLFGI